MAEIIILNLLESIKYFLIFQLVFNGKLNNRKKGTIGMHMANIKYMYFIICFKENRFNNSDYCMVFIFVYILSRKSYK